LEEEVEDNRKVIKLLKQKYQEALNEIQDYKDEQELEKNNLVETIKQQELDMSFYKKIAEMLLKPKEIQLLRHKSTFDEDSNEYKVPPFKLKDNEISLPQMKGVGYKVMEAEKENREMQFDN